MLNRPICIVRFNFACKLAKWSSWDAIKHLIRLARDFNRAIRSVPSWNRSSSKSFQHLREPWSPFTSFTTFFSENILHVLHVIFFFFFPSLDSNEIDHHENDSTRGTYLV